MDKIIQIGIILLFLGIILIFVGSLFTAFKGEKNVKYAVGGFIGIIPFGIFNDKRMFYVLVGLMIAIFIISLLFRFLK